ncbi:hypothetical protein EC968_001239 [Mortierella alpina]|nr:hypothetical protein EC968_001239 [Mortierella alpina]
MLKSPNPLDDPRVSNIGLVEAAFIFKDVPFKTHNTPLANAQEDDEIYGRGGYATAVGIPIGHEFTVEVPRNGTKTNDMLRDCQGHCEREPWYMGFDDGFAALAGIKVDRSSTCAMALRRVNESKDEIGQEILRLCDSRCANFLYGTTLALSKRVDPPGYRTLVALLSNWGSWVSCSMYDSLTNWTRIEKGTKTDQDFAWADTLHTSKIHFVDADLKHIGRPHSDGLLDKGPGWDHDGSAEWIQVCKKYGLRGTYMRQTIGVYVLMFEIGMYDKGRTAWSCMVLDTKFFVDYNLATDVSPCAVWWNHVDKYSRDAIVGCSNLPTEEEKYVAAYAVGCAYGYGASQVKQRREQEAGKNVAVRRGGVVWDNRELWSSFLIVDAGALQIALMAGGCVDDLANCGMTRVVNDVIDLGYDWASGDVSNSILTMSKGKTDRLSLRQAYRKVAAVLNRMGSMRPDTVGSVAVVTTHAWQMCNSRHRVIACALVSDDPGIGPTEVSASWYEAAVRDLDPSKSVDLEIKSGELMNKQVKLTTRTWNLLSKDKTGMVAKMIYYGHVWLMDLRQKREVASATEILEAEDILRILMVTMVMEMDRADFIMALWCWTIESWCASDLMWHAMIGSTALSSERQVGSDRWDDENKMQQWVEQGAK